MALRYEGFEVDSAGRRRRHRRRRHAAAAADRARRDAADFDGFEVARRLAAAHVDVPIIFLTRVTPPRTRCMD